MKGQARWVALLVVLATALTFGALRDRGPRTDRERVDAIARTIKCPVCSGESVAQSRVPIAASIREEIARRVAEGKSDDEIHALIERGFPGSQLIPPSSGFASLIWVLPIVAMVLALFGLGAVFRRWRSRPMVAATDEDRALVATAMAAGRGEAATLVPLASVDGSDGPS